MNVTEELRKIADSPAHNTGRIESRFWRLVEIAQEMDRRVLLLHESIKHMREIQKEIAHHVRAHLPIDNYDVRFDDETEEHLSRQVEQGEKEARRVSDG